MSEHTFKGGIHPPERKELSEHCPIKVPSTLPKTVSIPLTMGGAPNQPLVQPGDDVARGQIIADNAHPMGVPVHASIAGKVKKIEAHLVAGNTEAPCIVIEADGSGRESFLPPLDPFTATVEDARKRIHDAGIVGMGGAAFPTHVKLNPPKGKVIEYVIANAAECEPYLTVDKNTIQETPDRLIDGMLICMHITSAPKGIIALEENKKELEPLLAQTIVEKGASDKVSVCMCKTKYPQGGEKNIVQSTVGREIPSGGLPADIGCVIQNVGTLCAISDAFRLGKPLIERALTVSGMGCENPQNIRVPIGTVIADLEGETIKHSDDVVKIISGGPMMGMAMQSTNFPVQKNTSGVLFLTARETDVSPESPCLGCGRCTVYCSCRLTPVMIVRSLKAGDTDAAIRFGLLDCVECGAWSCVCPAHIALTQHFRIGKAIVREQRAAAMAKAAAAKALAEKEAAAKAGAPTQAAPKGGN
ncbi:MAG: electron transport complex subunit RsxC [Spirochaetaceae bacterium]|jgi:electron transport complex protein RnfC|nr:electron transport complex subunit RsxC [Spirochaetaceae bacterium]